MYKYLLWDIDGTILDFQKSQNAAIKALFQKYNLMECTDEILNFYSEINIRYWEALECGKMTKQEILVGRFVEFFSKIGVDTSISREFNEDYLRTLGDYVFFEDGAKKVLEMLKEKYVLIGVTNGTKTAQTRKLKVSGLDGILDSVFISEDVGVEKPNKEYFDYVFRQVGIEDAGEVLIIGDSLTSDMKGGNNAGIDNCWYNPAHKDNTEKIPLKYEISSIMELTDILGL